MTLNPDWGTRWCMVVGLIGVGSSRDSEPRGFTKVGNSVVLTEWFAAAVSSGAGCGGDLGVGELSLSVVGGVFSVKERTSGEAVIERVGVLRPVITTLAVDSETMVGVCLGRAKPCARFDNLSLMFVGERMSFLELVGVADRTGGAGLAGTAGELHNGELAKDLMSIRGFEGKLRPEEFDRALPGRRGWTRVASGASSSEELSEESEVSLPLVSLLAAQSKVIRITLGRARVALTCILDRHVLNRRPGRGPALDGCGPGGRVDRDGHRRFFLRSWSIGCRPPLP